MDGNRRLFGDFELDLGAFRLLKHGAPVQIEPKAIDVLRLLVDRAPRAVEKAEIFATVWKDVSVTDNALTRIVAQLRRALDDDTKAPKYIETIATRGYRFIAPVTVVGPSDASADAPQVPPASVTPPSRAAFAFVGGVGVLGAVIVAAWMVGSRSNRPTASPDLAALASLRPTQVTSSSGLDAFPALSPDGHTLAFSSDRSGVLQIYVQALMPGSIATALTSDSRQNVQPRWSPDGQFIAYHAMGADGIWVVPARGGSPRQLAEFGSAPAWSPDGRRLAFQSQPVTEIGPGEGTPAASSRLWTVGVAGGPPQPLTQPEDPPGFHFVPVWSPDGRRVYFPVGARHGSPFGPESIWSVDIGTGKAALVAISTQLTRYLTVSPEGDQLFFSARDTGLPWRLRLLPSSGQAVGEPEPVGLVSTGPGARQLSVSADGRRYVWTSMSLTSNIWSIEIDPGTGRARSEPVALTGDAGSRATAPAVSGDGRVAFSASRTGTRGDVFLLVAGAPRQVTVDSGNELTSRWTADGREIVAMEFGADPQGLYAVDPETGRSRLLLGPLLPLYPPSSTVIGGHSFDPASGRFAVGLVKDGIANIWIGGGDGHLPGSLHQLTFEKEAGTYPALSPDGRWVAYQCSEGTLTHVCVVTSDGGASSRLTNEPDQSWVNGWAPDNDRIAFAARRGAVWNVAWVSRTSRATHTVTSFTRPSQYVRYPVWAPGRDRIVFERGSVTGQIWSVEIPGK